MYLQDMLYKLDLSEADCLVSNAISTMHLSACHWRSSTTSLNTSFLGLYDGQGNGNPPQYSCLENPMEGGAW